MPIGKLLIDVERFKTPVDTILILSAKKLQVMVIKQST